MANKKNLWGVLGVKRTVNRVNHREIAELFAPAMFGMSLTFLALLAVLIVLWVDVPRFRMVAQNIGDADSSVASIQPDLVVDTAMRFGQVVTYVVCFFWMVIGAEVLFQLFLSTHSRSIKNLNKWRIFAVLQCLCPPLRLAAPNIAHDGEIWLPWIGWQTPNRKLYRQLERGFSKPMLFFALMILPLLLVEFALHNAIEEMFWLRMSIHVCTGLIWCAFAIEFIVLVSASEKRLAYVKKNWIDLAIILLPIALFLRSLRAFQLARLTKVAKIQQLMKMSRIYRVRGVAMKVVRALMLLEGFSRLLGVTPEKRLDRLRREFAEKQEELEEISMEIKKIEAGFESAKNSCPLPDTVSVPAKRAAVVISSETPVVVKAKSKPDAQGSPV